ncbi:hypothetical protein BAOM_4728 [Peribacillus asahii]|uniref:Uncharacterized protein n=1 Tax=Peribacillus asahii TaxID=228899 RepID=A0A3Q9RQR7_9BACI|nr:hypothetical protein BAOM_4728 [Peribacillus asahii]
MCWRTKMRNQAGKMSFIRVMKDEIEKSSQENVLHQGDEGQN